MINASFRHGCFFSSDLARSIKFYKLFGLRVVKKQRLQKSSYVDTLLGIKNMDITYVKFHFLKDENKAPLFELHCWRKPKITIPKVYSHLAFTVDNLIELYEQLHKKVRFVSPPLNAPDSPNMVCFCYDPDGNMIELVEDREKYADA